MTLDTRTVSAMVTQTTAAISGVTSVLPRRSLSISMIFIKQTAASAAPQRTAVCISFHTAFGRSENSSSPREMARIIVTEACEPELPPVSISIGMNEVSTTCAASALSKPFIIMPVNVAETIRSMSHGIRSLLR